MSVTDNREGSGYVFMRHEIKYRVPSDLYPELLARTRGMLRPDFYPYSNILNIYYDTEHDDLISRSMAGNSYKEKLRLRGYGIPRKETMVFAELKKKYDGVVYKRRAMLPCLEAESFLNSGIFTGHRGQIIQEIDYFRTFYHPVPKLFIAYERNSFAGIQNPDLRVTFDYNIRYREDRLCLRLGDDGRQLDLHGDYLMEIKVQDAIPAELSGILSSLKLYPNSFSKYAAVYRNIHSKEERCLQAS